MKLLRNLGIAFALFLPALAIAGTKSATFMPCCDDGSCCPCPLCNHH